MKWLAYKKAGIGLIDTSQEGQVGTGQAPLNTMFNGFDDTIKVQAVQAIQLVIDSLEQTASSITGVFRERLNGIQQRDAVTNVQVGINNSQMASMFIENPLNKISYLFQTHPSVEDRVKALRNY